MLGILDVDELVESEDVLELIGGCVVVVAEEGGVQVGRVGTLLRLDQGLTRQQSLEELILLREYSWLSSLKLGLSPSSLCNNRKA